MKRIIVCLLALGAIVGCCKTEKAAQLSGFITDATMNTIVVKALTSDTTYVFSTEDADKTAAYGLLLGNLVMVDYVGELKDITAATKIVTDKTYADAVGRWTMADPINAELKIGVDIMVEGVAASINMATLQYTAWELKGPEGEIILCGNSIGNGVTEEFKQDAKIVEKDGKLTLEIVGTDWVLVKE